MPTVYPLKKQKEIEKAILKMNDNINNPSHYGGKDNPYEAIKVIEAWKLNFNLGNTTKYISRCGKKEGNSTLQDLKKAKWYLEREIERLENGEI